MKDVENFVFRTMRKSLKIPICETSNASMDQVHDDLIERNTSLKRELWDLLNLIDAEARHNALHAGGCLINGKPRSRADTRRELEDLNTRIAKLKSEIDRSHQVSSLRAIEDRMRATRKELAIVNDELSVLRQEASCQRRVLESNPSQQLIHSLKQEIAVEKLIHAQLRKEAMTIGPSQYTSAKSATVSV
jgi:hypothetical protein